MKNRHNLNLLVARNTQVDFKDISSQNHRSKKKSKLFCASLCIFILAGCGVNMKDLGITFTSPHIREICNKNKQIVETRERVAALRSEIDYLAKAVKQNYYILQNCQIRSGSRHPDCLRLQQTITVEEYKLHHLRLDEAEESGNYSAFATQCSNYVSDLPAGTSYDSYQVLNMRWAKTLGIDRVKVRRAAIEEIAQEHNIWLTVWETWDKTNTYLIRDIMKLEYRFFDDDDNLTYPAKEILPAIIGKYALRFNAPSPPTLTVVIPFSSKSDADRLIAKGRAEKQIDNLRKYLQDMLNISRPINYNSQAVKEGTVDTDANIVIIQEAASK